MILSIKHKTIGKEWLLLPLMLYHFSSFALAFEIDEEDGILNHVSTPGLHFELSNSMDGLNVTSSYQRSVSTTALSKHSFEEDILYVSFLPPPLVIGVSYLIGYL